MSRSAIRSHSRLLTEPNRALSKSFSENTKRGDEPTTTTSGDGGGGSNLPPYITEPQPPLRFDEPRLRFPHDNTERSSPSRYSAQREFKSASEKLDALTRKLSLIHKSLVTDSEPPVLASTPVSKRATEDMSAETRLARVEGKLRDLQDLIHRSVAELRDENALLSIESKMQELESMLMQRLSNQEAKTRESVSAQLLAFESEICQLDAKITTTGMTAMARCNNLEDEYSIQNQRIDALRRDVDKLVESQGLLLQNMTSELRKLRRHQEGVFLLDS